MLIDLDARPSGIGRAFLEDGSVCHPDLCCLQLLRYGVYMETDGQGDPVCIEHNAMPYGGGEIDYN